jgi:hypothetical protein
MKGKLLFVAGAAVGYVFGARAGRKRYEQIKRAAQAVWETDGVQSQVHDLQDFAAQRIGDVPGALADGAKKAFDTVAGLAKNSSAGKGSAKVASESRDAKPAGGTASETPTSGTSTSAAPTSRRPKTATANETAANVEAGKSTSAPPTTEGIPPTDA